MKSTMSSPTIFPDDYYLSAVRVGGVDVKAFGLPGELISRTRFRSGAGFARRQSFRRGGGPRRCGVGRRGLMLIPDPPQRRLQDYRSTSADANGRFLFHGVAPGNYILVGWLDQAPCDVYDPDGLDRCRATGASVTVNAAEEQSLVFTVRALP